MYQSFFSLRQIPFAAEPDTDFVHLSSTHNEALGYLLYAVGPYGGFTQLTGSSGSGKTTIVRTLLAQKLPDVDLVSIAYPALNEFDFVRSVCDALGVAYAANTRSLKALIDALNRHLLATYAAGRRTILIVDEAQRLPRSVLEQVRLLTNLETAKHKLLRIILVGSPELHEVLARPNLRQLASRITARYRLQDLNEAETRRYIRHRLQVAGGDERLISREAIAIVHRHSKGNPRTINQLCDYALLLASQRHQRRVDEAIARQAVSEVLQVTDANPIRRLAPLLALASKVPPARAAMVLGAVLFGVLLMQLWRHWPQASVLSDRSDRVEVAEAQLPPASPATKPEKVPAHDAVRTPARVAAAKVVAGKGVETARADKKALAARGKSQTSAVAASQSPPQTLDAKAQQARSKIDQASASRIESLAAPPSVSAPAVVEAEPPPAPLPSLPANAGLQDMLQVDQPRQKLMIRLAQTWDRGFALSGEDICSQLPERGLQCRSGHGDLDALRVLNRPAVLTLELATGQTRRVLLRSLSANFASIESAIGTLVIPNEVLDAMWHGEYTAIIEAEGRNHERAPRLAGR